MKKNIPNMLSLVRVVLVPLFVVFFFDIVPTHDFFFNRAAALLIFALASLTDFFDGYIARRYGLSSRAGEFIDPLADKFLVLAILVTLALKFDFPMWLAAFIILRDILILWASVMLYRGKRIVKPSLVVGKFTFALLSMLIFVFIFDLHEKIDLLAIKPFLIVLTFSFLLWSWGAYFLVYLGEKNAGKKYNPGG